MNQKTVDDLRARLAIEQNRKLLKDLESRQNSFTAPQPVQVQQEVKKPKPRIRSLILDVVK